METNITKDQEAINSLALDLKNIEAELLPQLDNLAQLLPALYAGYARMVRQLVDSTINILQPSSSTGNKLMVAAEIGARSIQAYGNYKAAKEHNRMLAKYQSIKTEYAKGNLAKVKNLLPKLERSLQIAGKLFQRMTGINYALPTLSSSKVENIVQIQLKALNAYRTNLYLYELCKYFINEYGVWLQGEQRSKFDMPDYYLINEILAKQLFGKDFLGKYMEAAQITEDIKGAEVMLLSDSQLSMMALGEKPVKIHLDKAAPEVRQMIEQSGSVDRYSEAIKPYLDHLENDPENSIFGVCLLCMAAICCIIWFYYDCATYIKWLATVGGCVAAIKIAVSGNKRMLVNYVQEGAEIARETDATLERYSGKVEREDIDYNERSLLAETISGFLN